MWTLLEPSQLQLLTFQFLVVTSVFSLFKFMLSQLLHFHAYSNLTKLYCSDWDTVEPPIKDPLNKGHNRKSLPIKDTFPGPKCSLSHSANTFFDLGQPPYKGQKWLVLKCPLYSEVSRILLLEYKHMVLSMCDADFNRSLHTSTHTIMVLRTWHPMLILHHQDCWWQWILTHIITVLSTCDADLDEFTSSRLFMTADIVKVLEYRHTHNVSQRDMTLKSVQVYITVSRIASDSRYYVKHSMCGADNTVIM